MKSHKALKDEYKQLHFSMGVLQLRNTVNGKVFLDASVNLTALENRHRFQLEAGLHPNAELQSDWKLYSAAAFLVETLGTVEQREEFRGSYRDEVEALLALYLEERSPWAPGGYHPRA